MDPTTEIAVRPGRARDERGFSVIEVLIAVVLMAVVASVVTMASVGGNKLRGKARLQASLTASGLQVQEDLVTNRSWMESAPCRVVDHYCDVSAAVRPDSLQLKDVKGAAQLMSARSTALDSEVDGREGNDKDGVIPDYYRLEIVIRPAGDLAARYGSTAAKLERKVVTTVDRRGVEQAGSLAVEICRVTNQADERLSVQGCARDGVSSIKIAPCAQPATSECTAAWNFVGATTPPSESAPSPYVTMRRAAGGIHFTVRNSSTGQTWASGTPNADGLFVFQNLPGGDYNIDGLPGSLGGGSERWESKEVPAFHGSPSRLAGGPSVVVEPGLKNRALVLFRPAPTASGIQFRFDRKTYKNFVTGPHTSGRQDATGGWKPTDTYTGSQAAQMCARLDGLSEFGGVDECTSQTELPPNCAQVNVTGADYVEVGAGNGEWRMDPYGEKIIKDTVAGHLMAQPFVDAKRAVFCTFYREWHTHTYYATSGTQMKLRDGAVRASTYAVEPQPTNRVVDYALAPPGPPLASCDVLENSEYTTAQQCNGGIDRMSPGLNAWTTITAENASNQAANENVTALPSWVKGPLWVRPDGNVMGADRVPRGANPVLAARGEGECYWESSRFASEKIGECGRCNPMWRDGWSVMGACSLLTQTAVLREAEERVMFFNPVTGASAGTGGPYAMAPHSFAIPYPPFWACSGDVPRVLPASECHAVPQGGPATFQQSKWVSTNTGGTATKSGGAVPQAGYG